MVGIGRTRGRVCALAYYSDKSLNAALFNAAMPLLADCPWISEDLPSFHGHYYSSLPPEYSACSSKERPYEWCLMPQMPLMRVAQWVWGGFCIMREECASAHKSLWTSAVKVTNELWQSNTASPSPLHSLMGYFVPMVQKHYTSASQIGEHYLPLGWIDPAFQHGSEACSAKPIKSCFSF